MKYTPKPWVINLTSTILVVALSLAAYEHFVRLPRTPGKLQIALLDVPVLFEDQEKRVIERLTKPGLSDQERKSIMEAGVVKFGERVEIELAKLAKECDCIVIQKAALASFGGDIRDLTPLVRSRLGI